MCAFVYLLEPGKDALAVKPVGAGELHVGVVLFELLDADGALLIWHWTIK